MNLLVRGLMYHNLVDEQRPETKSNHDIDLIRFPIVFLIISGCKIFVKSGSKLFGKSFADERDSKLRKYRSRSIARLPGRFKL